MRSLGIEIRAGLHTGEIELSGDQVRGIAVHTGARIAAAAQAGEILVSSTITDLVSGSGIRFEDRGLHALKDIPRQWQLFAASGSTSIR
jgi:class 3 adenylate cyclase